MRRLVLLALLGVFISASARAEQPLRDFIDAEAAALWKEKNVKPAGLADDATLLRRIHLDLLGTIPTADEAAKFIADTDKKKRDKLIDRLLADKRYATQMTDTWDLAMFGRDANDPFRVRDEFRTWLTTKFAKNEPYDKLVKQILLGDEDGSQTYLASFRYRVEDATESVSRLFLGTQIHCARCHDHPYEEWKQRDFYAMAGFLVRVVVFESGNGPKRKFTIGEKSSGEVLFSGSAKDAKPGKKGDPVPPKFLGGKALDEPALPKGFKEPDYRTAKTLPKPAFSRKEKLAEWLTAKDNPYFARAAVNRVWGQLLGRGLVHPIDDLSAKSEPTMPAVLKRMTEELVKHDFDLKWFIKELVSSKLYQATDKGDSRDALPEFYQRARVRPLTAEEMLTAMRVATGFDAAGGDMKNTAGREYFRMYFGKPTNGQGDFQGSLREHLFMNNSGDVMNLIRRRKGNLADELLNSKDDWDKRVERLYLATLTRMPSTRERERLVEYLKTDDKRKIDGLVEDAIWALLNTAEFRFNR